MDATADELLSRLVDCVERTTRYPRRVLALDADLEDDLGIDSVKKVELVTAIAAEFDIPLDATLQQEVRTIAQIGAVVTRQLSATREPPAVAEEGAPLAREERPQSPTPRSAPPLDATRSDADRRVAFVTGSGRGLGRVIAERLASEGFALAVNSFHSRDQGERTVADIVARGGEAIHVWGSVANEEHVDQMFAEIDDHFGGLDVLVCNASDGKIGPFSSLSSEDWERAFRTNVTGHYACAMRASRRMTPRGGGSIVTLSTVGAHQYVQGFGSQGVVKAAVESLTRYLACELAGNGVRVNCVAAGPVRGELLDQFAQQAGSMRHWEAMTPGADLVTADEIADLVAFLCSPRSSATNGAVWTADRGFSAHLDGRLPAPAIAPLMRSLSK